MAVVDLFSASSDHKWLLLGVLTEYALVFPTAGGAPVSTHLDVPDWARWSGDGKHVFVSNAESADKTYVLPLSAGQVLPGALALARNTLSGRDLAKLPGVRIIPVGDVVPGPTAEIYAFTRQTVQRNVYRIPVP
jgi:hypothetical protein